MSELAFDVMGEPVEFPPGTEELRVRRFRNPGTRGACELVHDRDGAPLYVAVDTGYLEFRALVDGVPGRYRLDPVGEDRRSIQGAVPAYVSIAEVRNAAKAEASEQESVIRELARANAEMVKVMAERFAEVMQAAAELLRAADGAGLSRREPIAPAAPRNAGKDDEEDEDEDDDQGDDDGDDEESEAAKSPDIAAVIAQLTPMLHMWLATKMAPQPQPAEVPAVAMAPAQPSLDQPVTELTDTPRNGRSPSPAQESHLLAIHSELDPSEKRIAEKAARRMAPEVRAEWLDELSALTVDEAVARVRSMIEESRPRPDEPVADRGPSAATAETAVPSRAAPTAASGVGVPTAAAQLMAIYAALEPHEKRFVESVAARMTADARAEWLQQVCAMSTAEAVALVRALIPKQEAPRGQAPANGKTAKERG